MQDGSHTMRTSGRSSPRKARWPSRGLPPKSPTAWAAGHGSRNSPGHGSIDGQSRGVRVAEPSCRDGVHWLALPTRKGYKVRECHQGWGWGGEKEEKGEVLSAQ